MEYCLVSMPTPFSVTASDKKLKLGGGMGTRLINGVIPFGHAGKIQ